jgi:hypothetical protein
MKIKIKSEYLCDDVTFDGNCDTSTEVCSSV